MIEVNSKLQEAWYFVAKLLIAGLVFNLILYLNPSTYQIQAAFASLMASMLSLAGIEVIHEGIRLFTDEAVYIIVQDCLGWKSMAVLIGLVFASSKRTLEHLNFLLAGITILFVANIVRVFSTIYLAEAGIISFDIIHGFLWRWSLTVLVIGLWIFWFQNYREQLRFEARIQKQVKKLHSE